MERNGLFIMSLFNDVCDMIDKYYYTIKDKKIIIFPYGKVGRVLENCLGVYGLKVDLIIDNFCTIANKDIKTFDEIISILSPSHTHEDYVLLVTSSINDVVDSLKNFLKSSNILLNVIDLFEITMTNKLRYRLEEISVAQIKWIEKLETNYMQNDFTNIEFFEEHILAEIKESLSGKIKDTNISKVQMRDKESSFLNGIIRKTKPKTIVEIGVSAGGSACIILNAIRDIDNAKLYSFDYNTIWHFDDGVGRKTGFITSQIVPDLIHKWELYTGGMPCKYFDFLPDEGIDICLIDTAHRNPGEHLNILEILPYMKNNGIVIFHDTMLHFEQEFSWTNCVSINTLKGKRIFLESAGEIAGLANIGAIILDDNYEDMLFPLFTNLSLPWNYIITEHDFVELFKHFSKYYSSDLVRLYIYCYCFYKNGGTKNKEFARRIARNVASIL